MPEPVVICRDVGKTYLSRTGSIEALHSIDVSVAAGTLAALVGPSGCGKSTLLRLLAGLDVADHGTLTVAERDPTTLHGRALRAFWRGRVTYVAQRPSENLVPHLTLRQHLSDPTDLRILEGLGLSGKLDRRASLLSGGEQARAGLGIALSRPTPIVLIDEPTAELDHDTADLVLAAIRAATENGKTVIAATHDQAVVAAADTTIDLDRSVVTPRAATQSHPAHPTGKPGLAVDRLTKAYGPTSVVEAVSFSLESGQTGILLGRSGSGKSTLLMMIGGWLQPDDGKIVVDGTALERTPSWHTVAYLPQRFGLLPELTLRENVELPFRPGTHPRPLGDSTSARGARSRRARGTPPTGNLDRPATTRRAGARDCRPAHAPPRGRTNLASGHSLGRPRLGSPPNSTIRRGHQPHRHERSRRGNARRPDVADQRRPVDGLEA